MVVSGKSNKRSLSRSGYRLRFEVGRDRIRVSLKVGDRVRVRVYLRMQFFICIPIHFFFLIRTSFFHEAL